MDGGIDWNAFPTIIGFAIVWVLFYLHRRRRGVAPAVPVSSLQAFKGQGTSLRQWLAHWPRRLLLTALALFLLAALNPRLFMEKNADDVPPNNRAPPAVQGIAMYFILDQSGSMGEKAQVSSTGGRVTTTKLALLKQMTKSFIAGDPTLGLKGRPNDMIGLVAFARTAQILSPLTLDHAVLLDQLNKLDIMNIKDQDGTGIGYAIYKTANLIAATRHFAEDLRGAGKPAYDIKDAVMILVTDGMQDPNPLDQDNRFRWMDPEQAAAFAKDQKIRLYVVNIDPQFSKPEWEANRKQMKRVAETTGGRFYSLSTNSNIADIYKEIDTLAKSTLPVPVLSSAKTKESEPQLYTTYWLYPWLIAFAMVLIAVAIVLQTTWLRPLP